MLLETARDMFAEKGYAGATTKEIAERAQVSEALLFRNFGSKASLFAEAVLRPVSEFVTDFIAIWQQRRPWTSEALQREFIEHFYDVMKANKGLVLSLIAASAFDPEAVAHGPAGESLADQLDRLEHIATQEVAERGIEGVDVPVATRAVIGMVLAVSVLDDWLLPQGRRRPSRHRLVNEMLELSLYGVLGRMNRPGGVRKT